MWMDIDCFIAMFNIICIYDKLFLKNTCDIFHKHNVHYAAHKNDFAIEYLTYIYISAIIICNPSLTT